LSAQETPPSVKVAIALDPSPDAALRFVIDPLSLTLARGRGQSALKRT
jgi:hypothetical protein